MKRALLICLIAAPLLATVAISPVTYYRDVVPVLQRHCLSCHRPGQIAPISFLSYRQTRPWADAVRQVVLSAKMPPWNPRASENKHVLSGEEADILVRWVAEGALAGDPKDAPPPVFAEEVRLVLERTALTERRP